MTTDNTEEFTSAEGNFTSDLPVTAHLQLDLDRSGILDVDLTALSAPPVPRDRSVANERPARESHKVGTGAYDDLEPFALETHLLGRGDNLVKTGLNFHDVKGRDLLGRNAPFWDWIRARDEAGIFQFNLAWQDLPNVDVVCRNGFNRRIEGTDFTSVDYLGLSADPRLAEAAIRAVREVGVHAVSVGALIGNFPLSHELEQTLCEWLEHRYCVLFPTGWAASYGAVAGLVRDHDFVVLDRLAHNSLHQGAAAATSNVSTFRHLDNQDAEAKIAAIRASNPDAAILVVTEGMYSMDGDTPDLKGLLAACRRYDAVLLVDVCHDLGASGPEGTGSLGRDGILADADIIVGSFSKALGANGGFAVVNEIGAAYAIKWFSNTYTFSSALSPLQAAVALEAIQIVRSDEGEALRHRLRQVSGALRSAFQAAGHRVYGEPESHIVPLHLGGEGLARIAGARAYEEGVVALVIEFPAVPRGGARFRFSMKPSYPAAVISDVAHRTVRLCHEAADILTSTKEAKTTTT